MTEPAAPQPAAARWINWSRLFGYDFFISFKLGAYPVGAQSYASDLARRLREQDFTVFFSEEEAPPGAELDDTIKSALRRSRVLVVVANEGALCQSTWVRDEVEYFRKHHPKRPVIPINVEGTIERFGPKADAAGWLLGGRDPIRVNETDEAVRTSIADTAVVRRVVITPHFVKGNTRLRWAMAAVGTALVGLTVFAGLKAREATREAEEARAQLQSATAIRLASEGQAMTAGLRPEGSYRGLIQILAAYRTVPSATVDAALLTEALRFRRLHYLRDAGSLVFTVAFSPDGKRIVSGSYDNTLRLWDATIGAPLGDPLKGHTDYVYSVALSPDGSRIVSGSKDNTLRLWDAATGEPLGEPLKGHTNRVLTAAFSPDGKRIVSGSWDNTLRLWSADHGTPLGRPLKGHRNWVNSVAFSPDGKRIVSGSEDNTLRLWHVATGDPVGKPLEGNAAVFGVAFSPDSKRIVSGSHTPRLWDAATGAPLGNPLKGHAGLVYCVAFSPDGKRIVSGSLDNTLRLWDGTTGAPLGEPLRGHSDWVFSVAFSPDGKRIVSGSGDETLRLWDAVTGAPLGDPLKGHTGKVLSVAFSPDGKRIVSGSGDNTLRLWDAVTGSPQGGSLRAHANWVRSVAFTADGRRIVSGSFDNTLRLWDAVTGAPLGEPLTGHANWVVTVAVSPDGKRIVSGSWHSTLMIWPVFEAWADLLCAVLERNPTQKEWDEWVGKAIPYTKEVTPCPGLTGTTTDAVAQKAP